MTSTAVATPTHPPGLARTWVRGWGSLALLLTDLLTGVGAIVLSSVLLASIVSLPGALVTLPLAVGTLLLGGWLGRAERHRVGALTGATIDPPTVRTDQPLWRRLVLDPADWRAAAYWALHALWGTFIGAVTLAVLAQALLLALLPLIRLGVDVETVRIFWGIPIGDGSGPWVGTAIGVVVLLLLPLAARALAAVDVNLARWLLGADRRREVEQLSARVDTLTESRRETVDSVEAERRRIERDLHDGPQQRLVSIAMSLGMARDALERDPATARELVDEAHASAKEAIVEMRQVARGIVPPILADRGLDAALSALANRSPLPVSVTVRRVGRVDPTLEAIAYFVVSEALTNVAKHAAATSATVDVSRATAADGEVLALTVSDDGRGGADPSHGTGLAGLQQRVAAVDGQLYVTSPAGGPTTLHAVLPLRPGRSQS